MLVRLATAGQQGGSEHPSGLVMVAHGLLSPSQRQHCTPKQSKRGVNYETDRFPEFGN
jgi:hypothetical protein